ncbi:MAG: pseudouridine synthase [Fidelibacterota bacterium]
MRLNKFLAKAGVASRRESDRLIQEATTIVNGVLQTDPAFDVSPNDSIYFNGKRVTIDQHLSVIALNKPKGYITTASDPKNRKTVNELVPQNPRLFTIGRLDRNTTGLLLFTNDGDLAQELMLPKNKVSRIYDVEINQSFNQTEMTKIDRGIYIGWGQKGKANIIRQIPRKKSTIVRLELHQGKNREIRRIMNKMNRKVFSLHRISYGPIDVKGLSFGQWRTLSNEEINLLRKSQNK